MDKTKALHDAAPSRSTKSELITLQSLQNVYISKKVINAPSTMFRVLPKCFSGCLIFDIASATDALYFSIVFISDIMTWHRKFINKINSSFSKPRKSKNVCFSHEDFNRYSRKLKWTNRGAVNGQIIGWNLPFDSSICTHGQIDVLFTG